MVMIAPISTVKMNIIKCARTTILKFLEIGYFFLLQVKFVIKRVIIVGKDKTELTTAEIPMINPISENSLKENAELEFEESPIMTNAPNGKRILPIITVYNQDKKIRRPLIFR